MSSAWHIEDETPQHRDAEIAAADGTVSLSFVRSTLRRVWYLWVGSMVLGVALATAFLALVPPPATGVVTLLLIHDDAAEPAGAMETDVRLLLTRSVAQQLSDELGSDESPDDLIESIVAEPSTTSILRVEIRGEDPDDAVRRARLLAESFLGYREQQLTEQARAVAEGYRDRIDGLQTQVDDLTAQYDLIISRGGGDAEAAGVLSLRGQLLAEIATLQGQIESETLESNAIVVASRVLDQASLVPQKIMKRTVLVLGSGLIGGLGLGLGLITIYAITTGRLRSRGDVATAMGLPVAFSAGDVRGRRHRARSAAELDVLVDGLEQALPQGKAQRRLGVVTVDCEREGQKVVDELARRLGDEGATVAVVSDADVDTVADVVLTLVPFEIGRGLTHATSQASRWVVLVRSGSSTAEQLSTVSRSASAAGLDVEFVMLVGADATDASFGGSYRPEAVR